MTRDPKVLRSRNILGWMVTLSIPAALFAWGYFQKTPSYEQPWAPLISDYSADQESPAQFAFHWDVYETEELALKHCDVPIMIVHISSQDTPEWGCPQDENENG